MLMRRALRVTGFCGAVLVLLAGCDRDAYQRMRGNTMGTYYALTMRCPQPIASSDIEGVLDAVNAAMSTYLPTSELSRFNDSDSTDWFEVSEPLARLVALAGELSRQSDGAFDVTVGPLVNLWGFGPGKQTGFPDSVALEHARSVVGYQHVEARIQPGALRKDEARVYVDLSAIAKGYGVDRLLDMLVRAQCTDAMVDIGGEVAVRGISPSGKSWRIGIEVPDGSSTVQRVLELDDRAVATSGDYRNFIERDGVRVSHTIDARTGWPVNHDLASVSVVMPDAALADGYATLLHVLGPEDGMAFARERGIPALLLLRRAQGFEERYTPSLESYLVNATP
ncbi:MAG: FAD:protein FMN transferase [Pseudomonadales bacterium]|nr:FAD:protein FMN transferase [Pseudomonadales bacterium]MDP6826344.1 FAD:protein FMN transferase [Pseudomonadales bacterium]MDP6973275.1 FAD:protein FMN transferase [Pseudomonadales bacterium]